MLTTLEIVAAAAAVEAAAKCAAAVSAVGY